jgi:hypothetical protein
MAIARHRVVQPTTSQQIRNIAANPQRDFARRQNFAPQHDPEKWVPVFGKDHAPRSPSHRAIQ